MVYRAREEGGLAPMEVAVKLLGAGVVGSRDDAGDSSRKSGPWPRIDHEHIVPYRGSGEDRGQLYYVMRYMRGSSLARFLEERREPMDPVDAARLMIQIAEAVRYLHAQQRPIVHRDLKPHNILLDEDGQACTSPTSGWPSSSTATASAWRAARAGRSLTSRRSSSTAGSARSARRATSTASA